MKFKLVIIIIIAIAHHSCIKENQRIEPLSVSSILVSNPWKYKNILKNGKVDINDCDRDDVIFYFPDFSYKSTLSPLLCSWGPQQNELNGTWALTNQDSVIKATLFYSGIPLTTEAKIQFITKDSFKVFSNVLGNNFELTYIPK